MPHSIPARHSARPSRTPLAWALIVSLTLYPATLWAQYRPQPGANPVQPGANPNQTAPKPRTNPNTPAPAKPNPNDPASKAPVENELGDPNLDTPVLATPRELESNPRLLTNEIWQEYSYGLSFQVPAGGTLDPTVSPQRVAAVILPEKYEITVAILPVQGSTQESKARIADQSQDEKYSGINEYDLNRYDSARNAYDKMGRGTRKVEKTVSIPLLDGEEFVTVKQVNQVAVNQQVRFLKSASYSCSSVRMFKDLDNSPIAATQPATQPAATQPTLKVPKEKGFPAYVTYYYYGEKQVNAKKTIEAGKDNLQPMILGEAIILLSPKTFLSIKLRTTAEDFTTTKPVFESLLASFKCMSEAQMTQMRKKLIEAGDDVLTNRKLPSDPLAYPGKQWFRILEGDKDVGYMLMIDGVDEQNKQKGVRVKIETRTYRDKIPFVSESDFFYPIDQNQETWSIKLAEQRAKTITSTAATPGLGQTRSSNPANRSAPTTPPARQPVGVVRPTTTNDAPPPALNWTETGTFDNKNKNILVSRRSNVGEDSVEWTAPAVGYLTQVQSLVIQRLLPVDKPGVYGFYCYSPQAGNIFFRTERVVPHPTGKGVTIYTRASPEQREIVSRYDELGRLVQRDLPNGQSIKLADPSELAGIWAQKGLQ